MELDPFPRKHHRSTYCPLPPTLSTLRHWCCIFPSRRTILYQLLLTVIDRCVLWASGAEYALYEIPVICTFLTTLGQRRYRPSKWIFLPFLCPLRFLEKLISRHPKLSQHIYLPRYGFVCFHLMTPAIRQPALCGYYSMINSTTGRYTSIEASPTITQGPSCIRHLIWHDYCRRSLDCSWSISIVLESPFPFDILTCSLLDIVALAHFVVCIIELKKANLNRHAYLLSTHCDCTMSTKSRATRNDDDA